jgi:hypothetical protein
MRRAPDRVGRQDRLPLNLEEPLVVGDLLDEILSLRRYRSTRYRSTRKSCEGKEHGKSCGALRQG